MSEAAYRDLGLEMGGEFREGSESYPELGTIKTFVWSLDETEKRHRDALYALPPAQLALRAERYVLGVGLIGQISALIEQLRHPIVPVGSLSRAGFILTLLLRTPLRLLVGIVAIPAKLLSRRVARQQGVGAEYGRPPNLR